MQTQRMPDDPTAGFSDEQIDREVLELLLDAPWPWSLDELARELGHRDRATEALRRLSGAGLLHVWGEFVFPTRTARRAHELQLGTA
jgi:hypothetical protein